MQTVKQLITQRDELDKVIAAEEALLHHEGVTMETPLVTTEDFPRDDIDVYAVRHTRSKLIRLRTDRKALTDKIEAALHQLHTSQKTSPVASESISNASAKTEPTPTVHRTTNRPFLRIQSVAPGSPAEEGGLQEGDLVVQLAHLHGDNFGGLEQLSQVVKDHVDKTLRITILRIDSVKRLVFQPRVWSGSGVFGAAFLPLKGYAI